MPSRYRDCRFLVDDRGRSESPKKPGQQQPSQQGSDDRASYGGHTTQVKITTVITTHSSNYVCGRKYLIGPCCVLRRLRDHEGLCEKTRKMCQELYTRLKEVTPSNLYHRSTAQCMSPGTVTTLAKR